MTNDFTTYLSGAKLYGDDFAIEEISEWFADEAEAYANLEAKTKGPYSYAYHQLNQFHAFRFLRERRFTNALGIGGAYGDEFKPLAGNVEKIYILDPSDEFSNVKEVCGTPCEYDKPNPSGDIPFESNHFDLITSLGVMHHIPNVSHVITECYRCLSKGGIMLLREPIVSMGDWRQLRTGHTKRERGIPLHILDEILGHAGFKTIRRSPCLFSPIVKVANTLAFVPYNNVAFTMADALLSLAFSWNIKYYRTRFYEKFGPAAIYYVLEK